MVTPQERGQRWRRKRERAKGKPKIGRPPGAKTALSLLAQVRELYVSLYQHGHSSPAEEVEKQFGIPVLAEMKKLWMDMGLLSP
jgi:hypothetical protein